MKTTTKINQNDIKSKVVPFISLILTLVLLLNTPIFHVKASPENMYGCPPHEIYVRQIFQAPVISYTHTYYVYEWDAQLQKNVLTPKTCTVFKVFNVYEYGCSKCGLFSHYEEKYAYDYHSLH